MAGCPGGGSDRVGADQPADTKVITILDSFSGGEEVAAFDNEVERLSQGALRVRVVRNKDRGPNFEAAAVEQIRSGTVDLAMTGSRAWVALGAKRIRAIEAPLLIDSYRLQERVLTSELVGPMLRELRPLGVVAVGLLAGPIRRPFGVSRRLAAPEDFRNLTIGTQASRITDMTMRVLGATPRRLPPSVHDLSGLDGIERPANGIQGDGLDSDGSRVMTNVNLWPRPVTIVANERLWADLTPGQRRILRLAAANNIPKKAAIERSTEVEAANILCRRGHASFDSASAAELRALRRAAEPVYRDLERDPATRAAIRAIERLKRETAAPPSVLKPCQREPAEPAAAETTKLDGVWAMDTDRSAAFPEYIPENWGHWVFVFDRGRFAITQENKPSCTWGYGKFTVRGNRTSWTFTDGGGIAPTGAYNRPGEFFVYDLSTYRDTLELAPVEGQISPRNFRDRPWRRLSDKPTRRYFSKRCPPPGAALPD
jgi:TRAP-type C4-dicarboxylate transport system substrate-binding protein